MSSGSINRYTYLYRTVRKSMLSAAGAYLLCTLSILTSCSEEKKETISANTDPETFPTVRSVDVNTVISDSGITRYRIETPLWLMFEEAKDPTWKFPNGVHLEKFDDHNRIEASIDCDSATFFKVQQIWKLDGYVNIRNTIGEKFLTNQLFWDQRKRKVYSDSLIHIERQGKIIEGYGFNSNETMTHYNVRRVSAIFPASQFKPDSTKRGLQSPDTIVAGAVSGPQPQPAAKPLPRDPERVHESFKPQKIENKKQHP